jgi:hypothetical protein
VSRLGQNEIRRVHGKPNFSASYTSCEISLVPNSEEQYHLHFVLSDGVCGICSWIGERCPKITKQAAKTQPSFKLRTSKLHTLHHIRDVLTNAKVHIRAQAAHWRHSTKPAAHSDSAPRSQRCDATAAFRIVHCCRKNKTPSRSK